MLITRAFTKALRDLRHNVYNFLTTSRNVNAQYSHSPQNEQNQQQNMQPSQNIPNAENEQNQQVEQPSQNIPNLQSNQNQPQTMNENLSHSGSCCV